MPKPPAFQFYARDWMADAKVKLLPLDAQGAYVRMMCVQWMEGELALNPDSIATECDLNRRSMARLWPLLSPFFPVSEAGTGRANPRLYEQWKLLKNKSLVKSAAGLKGALARWQPHDFANGKPITEEMRLPMAKNGSAVAVAVPPPHSPPLEDLSLPSPTTTPPPAGADAPTSKHQKWMDQAVKAWRDLCPADQDCGGFLARTAKTYGYLNAQHAIEHMYAVGWNPDPNHTDGDPVKAFRSYLSKAAQGTREKAEA